MGIARVVLFCFIAHCGGSLFAQSWQYNFRDSAAAEVFANQNAKDSLAMWPETKRAKNLRKLYWQQGYWLAEVEVQSDSAERLISIKAGEPLKIGDIHTVVPEELNLFLPNKPQPEVLNSRSLQIITDYWLQILENRGYPFSTAEFKEYSVKNDSLSGELHIKPGPLITFDSLVIKGYDKLSDNLIFYDLGFRKGRNYSETYLKELDANVNKMEYLNFSREPAVGFFEDKTTLYLYLQEEKSNQIDGVVGLNTNPDGETTVNGQFDLRLVNTFNSGESLALSWQRPDQSVQSLDFSLTLPYLFKTPFWLEGALSIFRQDSSFVNTDIGTEVKYRLNQRNFLTGSLQARSSNILDGEDATTDRGSFSSNLWGLGLDFNETNRALVPTDGYRLRLTARSGNRSTADTSLQQYAWDARFDYFWDFFPRHILKSSLASQGLVGGRLFENELYRIGGIRTLRGFNERSIFSSAHIISTLEYRFMLGAYDYLTAFADVAYVEKNTRQQSEQNWLTGLGAGMNFRTGAGIFSLFFAVGKTGATAFDLRATKVHIGYVSRF